MKLETSMLFFGELDYMNSNRSHYLSKYRLNNKEPSFEPSSCHFFVTKGTIWFSLALPAELAHLTSHTSEVEIFPLELMNHCYLRPKSWESVFSTIRLAAIQYEDEHLKKVNSIVYMTHADNSMLYIYIYLCVHI